MAEEDEGPSDGEEVDEAKPSSSFFDLSNSDATELLFTDVVDDGPVPGESDDDDDYSSAATDYGSRRRRGKRGKKNHRRIVVSLVSCKYDVVAQAARGLGWRCSVDDGEEFNLLWNDSYVPFDTIAGLNKYQKTNHFPGMSELAKKNLLAKNMNRIAKALPGEFGFVPSTFILPGESEALKSWFQSQVGGAPPSCALPPFHPPSPRRRCPRPPPCQPPWCPSAVALFAAGAAPLVPSLPPAHSPLRRASSPHAAPRPHPLPPLPLARRSADRPSSSSPTPAARAAAFSLPNLSTSASRWRE